MKNEKRVCPVEKSGFLLSKIRKLVHNPKKMFASYVRSGDKVLEIGCGPGYFTLPLAKMVGDRGKVFALDLQKAMLDIVQKRAEDVGLDSKIEKILSSATDFKLPTKVDFCLLFYVVHEIPNIALALSNIYKYCKKNTKIFVAEPSFHVRKDDFAKFLCVAQEAGFEVEKRGGFLDRVAILGIKKGDLKC